MKEFRNPQDVHAPLGSYSHQIEIKGNERILVLAGQVGMREDGSMLDDPFEQIDLTFENIFRNLQAANMDVKDIIKLTYYFVGEIDTARRREVVLSKLLGHQPCSTVVYVAALAGPMFRVEIDAWASRAYDGKSV
jgi:enamine deaminase RidA (YjgF/YER057c/UK114 family)